MTFPRRNLGQGEPWGRHLEKTMDETKENARLLSQAIANLGRTEAARSDLFSSLIRQLDFGAYELNQTLEILGSRFQSETWESAFTVDSFGASAKIDPPSWARVGIVFAHMDAISNPGTGWLATVYLFAETYNVTNANTAPYDRAVAVGGLGHDPQSPVAAPTAVIYQSNPGARFLDPGDSLYLRGYATQVGGGSTSVTHRVELSTQILWIG